MRITIGTISNSLEFDEDIKLIKSSLLYADEVELIGMAEYALLKYMPARIGNIKDMDSLLNSLIPLFKSIDSEEARQYVAQFELLSAQLEPYKAFLSKKKCRSKKEILAQMKADKAVKDCKEMLLQSLSPYTQSQNANEIQTLVKKGIVSIFDYECKEFLIDELVGGYIANLLGIMQNNASFPLFDKASNDVISSCIDTKVLDLGKVNQEILVHAGLATNILMTLPTLENASFDEILDFKRDMHGPLINFRKAIFEFSEKVKSQPWDKDFMFDCLKLYSTYVAPNIEELNELSSETSVLKNMGRKVLIDEEIRKKAAWTAGGLAATITTSSNIVDALGGLQSLFHNLSLIVIAPNAISTFLKVFALRSEAKQEVKSVDREMKGNAMYYYFKASTDLSQRKISKDE